MAFSVTEFKSNLRQGGARPSLFKVEFQYPSAILAPPTRAEFLVKATTIPASTIGSYDVFIMAKRYMWPVIVPSIHGIQL